MLIPISKVLADYQVLKTIPLRILEYDSWTEPTVDEVFDFGESINLPRIKPNPNYPYWFNALHEVGHWAVKSEWYIEEWQKKERSPTDTTPPNLPHYYGSDFFDPTPDELGVRAWSHLVLMKKHWRCPTKCYSEEFATRNRSAYKQEQWLNFSSCNGYTSPMNGFEQLDFAGIDIERDIYRPEPQFGRQLIYEVRSNRIEKYAKAVVYAA